MNLQQPTPMDFTVMLVNELTVQMCVKLGPGDLILFQKDTRAERCEIKQGPGHNRKTLHKMIYEAAT